MTSIACSVRGPLNAPDMRWTEVRVGQWALSLAAVPEGLCGVSLPGRLEVLRRWVARHFVLDGPSTEQGTAIALGHLEAAEKWLHSYAEGTELMGPPLVLVGTDFQRRVWTSLLDIAPGDTWTYKQVAERVGRPNAARAVGQAVGKNPLPIFVPCHRVIGSNGKLVGFGGGLQLKGELLLHESNKGS